MWQVTCIVVRCRSSRHVGLPPRLQIKKYILSSRVRQHASPEKKGVLLRPYPVKRFFTALRLLDLLGFFFCS
jgi:hypothetical protein